MSAEQPIPDELEELRRILMSPELLVARIAPVISEILREEAARSPENLAVAIAPVVGEALRRQAQATPEDIAAALYTIIRRAVDRAVAEAEVEPAGTAGASGYQEPRPPGVMQGRSAWVRESPIRPSKRKWFGLSSRVAQAGVLLLIVLLFVGGCGWWVWRVEHTFSVLAMPAPMATPAPILTPTGTARPSLTPTATLTPTPTPTPTRTPRPSPTAMPSLSPTLKPLTLAVDRDVYALSEVLFSLLPAQHERLVVLPYTSQDPDDDQLATRLATWAIRWAPEPPEGAVLLREEPYVVAVHPLFPQEELSKTELVALASGQDERLGMVVGDSGRAACELLNLERLPSNTILMPDWLRAKEHVATHEGTWALLPWEAVDFRVRILSIEGFRPGPTGSDDYPLMRRLWLTQQAPAPQSLVDALLEGLRYEPPPTAELVAVGDIMLDRRVRELIEENTVFYPFEGEGIQPLLSEADIAFANLECPISDRGTRQDKGYEFRADPEVVEALVDVGLDVLSLANNHTGDYADLALTDTIRLLTEAGIVFVGAGHNITEAHQAKIVQANGLRVAFLAYNQIGPDYFAATETSPGSAFMDPKRMVAGVRAARQRADIVVVSCHWGIEYTPYPNASQQKLAQTLADAGATLIIGHHPHVVQGLGYRQEAFAAYSLGNLVFDQGFSEETSQGLVLRCLLDASGVKRIEFLPIRITECQPSVMSAEDGARVLERVLSVTEEQGALPRASQ